MRGGDGKYWRQQRSLINRFNIYRLDIDRAKSEKAISENANRKKEIDSNIKLRELMEKEKKLLSDVSQ